MEANAEMQHIPQCCLLGARKPILLLPLVDGSQVSQPINSTTNQAGLEQVMHTHRPRKETAILEHHRSFQ